MLQKDKEDIMRQRKRISLMIVFIAIFGMIAGFHESRLGKWIDTEVYEWIISAKSAMVTSFLTGVTRVGEVWAMVALSLILLSYLLIKKLHIEALFFTIVMTLSGSLNPLLKHIFDRERPTILRLVDIGGLSFPSGHAMGSTAFFGTLCFLAHRKLKSTSRNTIIVLSTVFIALIAISRVYLGVHYPTDVLAGIACGLSCIFITQLMLYRRLHEI